MKKINILIILLFFNKLLLSQPNIKDEEDKINTAQEYLKGYTKAYDPEKAFELYSECANNGNAKAMNAIALLYKMGKGVEKDNAKAIIWFKKAADKGYASAWYNLGFMYKFGTGTKLDYKESYNCFKQSAMLEFISGYYAQGYMLYKGLGCSQSYEEAVNLFRKGAKYRHNGCMYFLGLCMRNGYGIKQDEDSAKYWLQQAQKAGYQFATDELNTISAENNSLSTQLIEQINKAKKIANAARNPLNQYTKIANNVQVKDLEGGYGGYLLKYDYSGKFIVEIKPISLNLICDIKNNLVEGSWIEEDSIIIPITATISNKGLSFSNMKYEKTDHYSMGKPIQLNIEKAFLQHLVNNDSSYLTGSVEMYRTDRKEPEKPLQLVLYRNRKSDNEGNISFKDNILLPNQLIAYPNPYIDLFNIKFSLQKGCKVVTKMYTIDGKLVYSKPAAYLNSGDYVLPLQPNIAKGTYIVTLSYGNEHKSTKIIKN